MKSRVWISPDGAVLAGLIVAAVVYCRDLSYDFILDDLPLILTNDQITSWHKWKLAFRRDVFSLAPSDIGALHYRPIYTLWLMLNHALFGGTLPWWHLTSLLLHLAVVFLVYRLGLKLLHRPWTAALGTLLFAFHPIHVESVAYVTASTDMLVSIFCLCAFLAYARFREGGSPGFLLLAVINAGLAMGCKETGAMLPWMLVAYEALRDDSVAKWRRYLWTLPFFAVVAVYAMVRTLLFGTNVGPGPGVSRWVALMDTPLVLIAYLSKLLVPAHLSFYYPTVWTSTWTLAKLAAAVLIVVVAAVLWRRYRGDNAMRLQILWAGILFVPALTAVFTFIHDDWMHDRHMYLVSIPLSLVAAVLLSDKHLPTWTFAVCSPLIVCALLVTTALRLPVFSNEFAVYQDALRVAPRSATAHRFYAMSLRSFGKIDESLRQCEAATELSPRSLINHEAYADTLALAGQDSHAESEYATAVGLTSPQTLSQAHVLYRLGFLELKHFQTVEAINHLRAAVQIDNHNTAYQSALTQALRQQASMAP